MYWHIKSLASLRLVIIRFSGLITLRILSLWLFLELTTLRFIIYFSADKTLSSYKELIKLFFIQALSGIVLLILILVRSRNCTLLLSAFIFATLLFKIGSIPFHSWLLRISSAISWSCLFIFLTILKILPFQFLRVLNLSGTPLLCTLIFSLCCFLALLRANLKQIIIVSSLFFMGIIFLILQRSTLWLEFLLIYRRILLPLAWLAFTLNNNSSLFRRFSIRSIFRIIFFVLLINLTGVPPFAGFFLKYLWLTSSSLSGWIISLFLLSSSFIAFIYLTYGLKSLTWNTSSLFETHKSFIVSWSLVFFLSLLMVIL